MRLSVAESVYVPGHKLEISSKALEKDPGPDQDNVNGVALVTVVKISPLQKPKHETRNHFQIPNKCLNLFFYF